MRGEWDDALDALEEWVRRTADEVAAYAPPPPPPPVPATPLPVDLQLRARLIMARMRDVEGEIARRREQLVREQAYGAA